MEIVLIAVLTTVIILIGSLLLIEKLNSKQTKSNKSKTDKVKLVEKLPMEFSKKILVASYAIAIVVIIYTMYIVYVMVLGDYTGDPTSLNTLILLTLGELAGANSFYFWKAKSENITKLNSLSESGIEITEEDIV